MSDRIRANINQFSNYNGIDTNNSYTQDCMSVACSSAQMLTADAADWTAMVSSLPTGRGIIATPVTANELNVTVMWDDEGAGGTGTGCSNDPAVDLTCYTLVVTQ
jgi:hypothetical protein